MILVTLLPIIAFIHLSSCTISIGFSDFYSALTNFDAQSTNQLIIKEFRFPRLIMGIIAGGGLSVAGLLMQTLFNNPLAGPNILGINSGASLFVAFSLMSGVPFFSSDFGTIISALLGAFAFGLLILAFSMVVKSNVSLLLIDIKTLLKLILFSLMNLPYKALIFVQFYARQANQFQIPDTTLDHERIQ